MDPGLVVGATLSVGSIAYAWHTNRKASQELRAEAARLRQLSELILRGLENAGLVKVSRDDGGNSTGLVVEFAGHLSGKGSVTGTLS